MSGNTLASGCSMQFNKPQLKFLPCVGCWGCTCITHNREDLTVGQKRGSSPRWAESPAPLSGVEMIVTLLSAEGHPRGNLWKGQLWPWPSRVVGREFCPLVR